MRIVVKVSTTDGTVVFLSRDNYRNEWEGAWRIPGRYISRCVIPANFLNTSCYLITVSAEVPGHRVYFFEENVLRFFIQHTESAGAQTIEPWAGVVCPILDWRVTRMESPH